MNGYILGFIAVLITVFAFVYAILTLFKNKIPMYYRLPVGTVGCFGLYQLSKLVTDVCGGNYLGDFGICVIGIFGAFCFILSANYGQLDGIVDDKSNKNHKARLIAVIAPIVILALIVGVFSTIGGEISALTKLVFVVTLLPILPASYFCLKHLILPVDDFGFLKSSKMYNSVSLLAGVLCVGYMRVLLIDNALINGVCAVVMSLVMLCVVLASKKGVKIWQTLI